MCCCMEFCCDLAARPTVKWCTHLGSMPDMHQRRSDVEVCIRAVILGFYSSSTVCLVAGDGALLGAGVSVLGPIRVGAGCKVGAGSVVVKELPDYCVAVGVPARIIKQLQVRREPSIDMDQCDDFILDYVI